VDFSSNEEQLSFKKSVMESARNELTGGLIALDRDSEFDRAAFTLRPGK